MSPQMVVASSTISSDVGIGSVLATCANPTSFLARAKEGGQIKTKHSKPKARRWKRGKTHSTPSPPYRPESLDGQSAAREENPQDPSGSDESASDEIANDADGSYEAAFPFVNVCPECLNTGLYKAPIVRGGPALLFYCQCAIGTDALAGALNLFRLTQSSSRAGR